MKKSIVSKKLMSSLVITTLVLSLGLGILSSSVNANDPQFSKTIPQPLPPPKPELTGPTEGNVGVEYEFCARSFFSCPYVHYQFDWDADGGHNYSPWYGPYYSGEWCCIDHSWDEADTYNVRVWSEAPCGHHSPWSDPHYIIISDGENEPPGAPSITGPTSGNAGEEYEYTFTTTDPNGDDVYYYIDWEDGQVEEWIGPYTSGVEVTLCHTWSEQGTYTISAKAKDVYGAESEWGTLEVTMPVNQQSGNSQLLFSQFLERVLEYFPRLEHISHPCSTNVLGDWHVYPGDSIQAAVDNAAPSDTIYVHDDNGNPYTYNENVDVNKPNLELVGDGMDTVTVDAVNAEDHTFHITEDGITVTGFMVTGSYSCGYGGICLEEADNCVISDNNCRGNLCAGIFLKHCTNCEITNNIVSDNDCGGVKLSDSDNNVVKSNILENNVNMGMNVYDGSSGNLIYNNFFDNPNRNAVDGVPWANIWNISKTSGTNIIGGPYLGGNYFSDYTGEDNDGDGLGDVPYDIKNAPGTEVTNKDYLPLLAMSNNPPDAPTITGETNGAAGTSYEYGFTSTDPDGDQVSYYIKWGDGDTTDWTALQDSGPPGYSESHTWAEQGDYVITAKAKDANGLEGPEATLPITMPRNKLSNTLFLQLLERLFEHFPLLEHIFYRFTTI